MAKIIETADFETEVLKCTTPVLVDFYADWCGPCKMLAPIIEEIGSEHGEKFKLVKINVDNNKDLSKSYNVRSIPNMIFFKNGEVADNVVGVIDKDEIVKKLEALL